MRYENLIMFQDTMSILESGYYVVGNERKKLKLTRTQMEASEVYLPEDVQEITERKNFEHQHELGRCEYGCENLDSFSLARKRMKNHFHELREEESKPILVLNLANPVHPGGGVKNGAKAQEEDLCRKSSLLLSLESRNSEAYYKYNRSLDTYMGSDAVIINPYVEIIKDENGNLLDDTVVVSVLTCAAPMIKHGLEGMSQTEYEVMVYNRIEGMLKVAAFLGYKDLILGAFGCGAFGNDARIVSDIFYKVLKEFDYDGMKESDMFSSIIFAVMDHSENQYNYKEFCRNFTNFYRDEDKAEKNHIIEKKNERNTAQAVFLEGQRGKRLSIQKVTALYCRLSIEDGRDNESMSISNQKLMLKDYADKHGLYPCEYYVDDGYTGRNSNRPDFQRMLADIEKGRIGTVITKDLSRLARNYLESGSYIEVFFPKYNVRYIAITDGVDSLTRQQMDITPFKNILNDMYSRDISKKVLAGIMTRSRQGTFCGGTPPYGLMRDPADKGHLIINEEEAPGDPSYL